ncbi:PQQ-binding-like beta-propeller repeat protein [Streptomyces sp. NPDC056682]|uniref:outer membrane protein assembly factor BamB family protein n=1 Tax=Streptomyces sp. NPDC056682 TaxID=3345909 RepID=UPI003682D3AC
MTQPPHSQPRGDQPPQKPVPGNPYAQPDGGYERPDSASPGVGYGYPGQPSASGTSPYPARPPYPGGYSGTGQPSPPAAPPPGVGRRLFRGRRAVLVSALTAGLLLLGGGVYVWTGKAGDGREKPGAKSTASGPSSSPSVDKGDGKGPGGGNDAYDFNADMKPGEARVWVRENDTQLTKEGALQYGPWRAGDVVAKAMYKEITGYAVADGTQKWSTSLETPVCGAARLPSGTGKAIIATQENNTKAAHCTYLQQIDIATGQVGWKVTVPQESSYDTTNEFTLAVSGDTVVVHHGAYASGFSVTDGSKRFGSWKTAGCSPFDIGGGPKLISVGLCSSDDINKAQSLVEELDPATGKSKWNYKYQQGWSVTAVLSSDPLVVAANNTDKKTWNLTAFAPDGKVRWQVEPNFKTMGGCDGHDGQGLDGCTAAAADTGTLYLGTEGSGGAITSYPETNEVVAIDLGNGKEKWRTKDPKGRAMRPQAVEGGKLVAYVQPGRVQDAAAMATFAPAGGAPQVVLQSPEAAIGGERAFFLNPHMLWSGGRFFMLNGRVQSPSDNGKDHALLSFGK